MVEADFKRTWTTAYRFIHMFRWLIVRPNCMSVLQICFLESLLPLCTLQWCYTVPAVINILEQPCLLLTVPIANALCTFACKRSSFSSTFYYFFFSPIYLFQVIFCLHCECVDRNCESMTYYFILIKYKTSLQHRITESEAAIRRSIMQYIILLKWLQDKL